MSSQSARWGRDVGHRYPWHRGCYRNQSRPCRRRNIRHKRYGVRDFHGDELYGQLSSAGGRSQGRRKEGPRCSDRESLLASRYGGVVIVRDKRVIV
jgi:hypothetical protein